MSATWQVNEKPLPRHYRAFCNYCLRQGDRVQVVETEHNFLVTVERSNSMQQAQGVIERTSAKEFTDKKTGRTIYLQSFQLQGHPMWFRTGTTPVPAQEGSAVTFMYNEGNMQVDLSSVQQTTAPQAAPTPAPQGSPRPQGGSTAPAQRGGGGNSRENYWQEKEQRDIERQEHYHNVEVPRISFSAAQDRAVNLVSAALAADALSFGNSRKGDRVDMILDYVDQVTDRFFINSMYAQDRLKALEEEPDPVEAAYAGNSQEASDNGNWEE